MFTPTLPMFLCTIYKDLGKQFFKGGNRKKILPKTLWEYPPAVILKPNLNSSSIKHMRQGGWGGVIRDGTGQILIQLTRLAECLDANEAEIYAMLMGCRKLLKFGSHEAIIEDDSFSAIRWGSGKIK